MPARNIAFVTFFMIDNNKGFSELVVQRISAIEPASYRHLCIIDLLVQTDPPVRSDIPGSFFPFGGRQWSGPTLETTP